LRVSVHSQSPVTKRSKPEGEFEPQQLHLPVMVSLHPLQRGNA
jgi:hypothetical protein